MTDQGSLPIEELVDHPDADSTHVDFGFLTNRQNLLQVLSTGLLATRAAYAKYYPDLLEIAEGSIPFVRLPAPTNAISAVLEEGNAGSFPVIVDPGSWARDALYTEADDDAAIRTYPAAVPLAPDAVVYFRSQDELTEHTARRYPNVADIVRFEISPSLFEGEPADLTVPAGAGKGLYDADYRTADKRAGMLAALAAATPTDWLQQLGDVMSARLAKPKSTPSWYRHDVLLATKKLAARSSDDDRLLQTVLATTIEADTTAGIQPLKLLARIAESASPSEDQTKGFDKIRAVLELERDFEKFTPGKGSPILKALLLALLRPDPERLLSWSTNETGADDEVIVAAAAIVGTIQGWALAPKAEFPASLVHWLAVFQAECVQSAGPWPGLSTELVGDDRQGTLRWDGQTVVTKTKAPAALDELLDGLDVNDARVQSAVLELIDAQGWWDCQVLEVELAGGRGHIVRVQSGKQAGLEIQGVRRWTATVNKDRLLTHLADITLPDDAAGKDPRRRSRLFTSSPGRTTSQPLRQPASATSIVGAVLVVRISHPELEHVRVRGESIGWDVGGERDDKPVFQILWR